MVDIFEEVDEAISQDKNLVSLRKYGPWVAGAAFSLILATAGYQLWNASEIASAEMASNAFIEAQTNFDEDRLLLAAAGFDTLAIEGNAGYTTLALLQRAAVALDLGENSEAAGFFDQAANSTSDPLIKDLAELKSVWAIWDNLSFNDVEIRVTPLSNDTSPYRYLARETIATAAMRDENYTLAKSVYQLLQFSLDAPQGVQRRAGEALALITQLESLQIEDTPVEDEPVVDTTVEDVTVEDVTAEEPTAENSEEAGNE